jgi:predicted MFS family arabinose efflux permease
MVKDTRKVLVGGIVALAIVMGVGRFAYTPLLPLMQRDLPLPDDMAGYLASANYAGYLLGALWAALAPAKFGRTGTLKANLLVNLASTAGMGITSDFGLWIFLRFVSGVSSAVVFVLASGIVLQALVRNGRAGWSGFLYAGVGIGIALTALAVPVFDPPFGWRGGWMGLAILSTLLAWMPWKWLEDAPQGTASPKAESPSGPFRGYLPWLTAAYFCEGLGYIITGTFLVALLHRMPGLEGTGTLAWLLVGLAAIPSCVLWMRIGMWIGPVWGLITAHLVQAVGIVLPIVWPGLPGALGGAILFGGTFMGITTLTLFLGRSIAPAQANRAIGLLTAAFGTGQILGPSIAGILAVSTRSFSIPLIVGSLTVTAGALCLLIGLLIPRLRAADVYGVRKP